MTAAALYSSLFPVRSIPSSFSLPFVFLQFIGVHWHSYAKEANMIEDKGDPMETMDFDMEQEVVSSSLS